MSVDRCERVRKSIAAELLKQEEKISGEKPEVDGIYTVTISALDIVQASRLCYFIIKRLSSEGIPMKNVEIKQRESNATVDFHVNVGQIRAL